MDRFEEGRRAYIDEEIRSSASELERRLRAAMGRMVRTPRLLLSYLAASMLGIVVTIHALSSWSAAFSVVGGLLLTLCTVAPSLAVVWFAHRREKRRSQLERTYAKTHAVEAVAHQLYQANPKKRVC
jgi:hypothetical protein